MAGFELIVRPAVFPDIRPQAPRTLTTPATTDPTQGIAILGGAGGKLIDLTESYSQSWSRSLPAIESRRRVDKVRTYFTNADGTIDENQWVDTEVITKVWLHDISQDYTRRYAAPQADASSEIMETGVMKYNPSFRGTGEL